jgi:hypothetical protein
MELSKVPLSYTRTELTESSKVPLSYTRIESTESSKVLLSHTRRNQRNPPRCPYLTLDGINRILQAALILTLDRINGILQAALILTLDRINGGGFYLRLHRIDGILSKTSIDGWEEEL